MNPNLVMMFNGSVQLEKKLASLYRRLCDLFPEDGTLWCGLAKEEDSKAVDISVSKDVFLKKELFSIPMLDNEVATVRRITEKIDSIINEYLDRPPVKPHALSRALELEMIAGQFYLSFSQKLSIRNSVLILLRDLISKNTNHIRRIHEVMKRGATPAMG